MAGRRAEDERKTGRSQNFDLEGIMRYLTDPMRKTLAMIKAIRDLQVKRLQEENPGCTPSPWVAVDILVRIHHLDRRLITGLVSRGLLEERPSDGSGNQVLVKEEQ